jgi:hypothetical protein
MALLAGGSFADTLTLKDGRAIRGDFLGATANEVRFREEGRTQALRYTVRNVEAISFSDRTASALPSQPRTAPDGSWRQSTRTSQGNTLVPAGTVVTVRLIDPINSNEDDVGATFRASLDEPLIVNGRTLAPKNSDATVRIVRVDQARAISGREEVAVELASIGINGTTHEARSGHAVVASKSSGSQNVKVIGGTAVVGAIIGAIAGGGKGAAIGAASGAGAGAAVQAIRGQRVQIPAESKLDFTLSEPILRR